LSPSGSEPCDVVPRATSFFHQVRFPPRRFRTSAASRSRGVCPHLPSARTRSGSPGPGAGRRRSSSRGRRSPRPHCRRRPDRG
jgi:hypothetical protein